MLEQEGRLWLAVFDPESAAVRVRALIVASRGVLSAVVVRFDTEQVLVVVTGSTNLILRPLSSRWRRLVLWRLGLLLLGERELRDGTLIKRRVSLV